MHFQTEDSFSPNDAKFQRSVLSYLLSLSPSLTLSNTFGWGPLHHAAVHGHTEVCRALLAAGADVRAANRLGARAVDMAAASGHVSTVK